MAIGLYYGKNKINSSGFDFDDWKPNYPYKIDQYAVKNNCLYKAIVSHTSSTDFNDDIANWKLVIGGNIDEVDLWIASKDYVVGDRVKDANNVIYQCVISHTSSDFDIEKPTNWIVELNKYYSVNSQAQYNQMVADGVITSDNKHLYIVQGVSGGSSGGSGSLTQDIIANVDVGNTKSGFVFTTGMTFDDYVQAVHVAYLKPVINSLTPLSGIYEIGTTISPFTVEATISKQSNPIANVELYLNSTLLKSDNTLVNGGTISETNVNPNTNDTDFTISCTVDDGTSTTTKTNTFKFVRYGFYGCDTSSTTLTTSDEIRGLSNNIADPKVGTIFTINIPTGSQKVTISIPNGLSLDEVLYKEGMNVDVKDTFTLSTVNVEGSSNYSGIDYNTYTYVPAIPTPSNMTYIVKLK